MGSKPQLSGLHVALVTPFTDQSCRTIDTVTLHAHMMALNEIVDGYVFGGYNGEGITLSEDQVYQLVQAARELRRTFSQKAFTFGIMQRSPERIKVIAEYVAPCAPDTILLAPPLQGTDYDLPQIFSSVHAIASSPVCAYNTGHAKRALKGVPIH